MSYGFQAAGRLVSALVTALQKPDVAPHPIGLTAGVGNIDALGNNLYPSTYLPETS